MSLNASPTKSEIVLSNKQWEFERSVFENPFTFFGGAKGGGKSHALRTIMVLRRFMYPGSIGYIFRKTYPELLANHIKPILKQFPELAPYYRSGDKIFALPNGSELWFQHCERIEDVGKYQGREIHDLGVEEAGEWKFDIFDELLTCNRSGDPSIPVRCLLTGNPGGIGHKWLKRLFITKDYEPGEEPKDYHFIQSLVTDNPFLERADPRYKRRLETMKNPVLREAWRYGNWDISAGQFFDKLHSDIHLVDDFEIPEHWNRFGAYDYGFNHSCAWGFFAVDEDGVVYLYRTLIQSKMSIREQAEWALGFDESASLSFHAGRDCWAVKQGGDPTIFEQFNDRGVTMIPANIDRIQGASQVRDYLDHFEVEGQDETKRVGPRFKIFKSCRAVYDVLTSMVHDPKRVEDVLKVDASVGDDLSGDDAYDMVRYGLMSRPSISEAPKKVIKDRWRMREINSRPNWRTA